MRDGGGGRHRGSTDGASGMNTHHVGIEDIETSDLGPGRGQEKDTGGGDHTQDHAVRIIAKTAKVAIEKMKADQLDTIAMDQESNGGGAGHQKVEVTTMTAGDDETVSDCLFLTLSL